MEEKIYQAHSMLEALEKVQKEMGPEAVVVSVREIQSPAWSLQKKTLFEIKAAPAGTEVKPKTAIAPAGKPKTSSPEKTQLTTPASPKSQQAPSLLEEDDDSAIEWIHDDKQSPPNPLQKQTRPSLAAPAAAPRTDPLLLRAAQEKPLGASEKVQNLPDPFLEAEVPASLIKLKKRLASQDLDPTLLERILKVAFETLSPQSLKNEELVKKYLARQLEAELRISPSRDLKPPAPVVCLVGASGCGKTSLAARMAMYYGSRLEKKVAWICADAIRVGAIAEARTYTDALGLPLEVAYTPAELKQALNIVSSADLTLVDLPGYNPLDEKQVEELGTFLTEIPNRSLLLVASASQKEKDLFQAASSFGIFGLSGLVITKMDESLSLGSIYNLAQKTQIPLVYFSSGKGTAGKLQSASAEHLVSALFHPGDY